MVAFVSIPCARRFISTFQSTVAVLEDSASIKAQFYELHDDVCKSLRDRVEGKISAAKTTDDLVQIGSTEIGDAFARHANHLQMFLNSSFEGVYTRRQAQVRASVAGLFSGVQWVDHRALFSRPAPWICILTGAALAAGVEFLTKTPFVDLLMSPLLGATTAAVGYGIFYLNQNRGSFSPPELPGAMDSGTASAALAKGAIYQNAAANPNEASKTPMYVGKAVTNFSGNPIFALIGASVSIGLFGIRALSDKLSGRLEKMRNEMRGTLKPLLDDFETKTRENGMAAIDAGESTALESLSFVLDKSMERYEVILDRLLRPHRRIRERLEQRRNEIQSDVHNLRKLQEQVLSSRSLLVAELKGISPVYSDSLSDSVASEGDGSSMVRSNQARPRIQLLDEGQVAESFQGDRSLILSWFGCLAAAIILAAVTLIYAGVFRPSKAQTASLASANESVARPPIQARAAPPKPGAVSDDDAIRAALHAEGYVADGVMTDVPGAVPGSVLHVQKVSCLSTAQPCEKLFIFAGSRGVWSEVLDSSNSPSSFAVLGPGEFSAQVSRKLPDGTNSVETVRYQWNGKQMVRSVESEASEQANTSETYSNMHVDEETGDWLGWEVEVDRDGDGYRATVFCGEGVPEGPFRGHFDSLTGEQTIPGNQSFGSPIRLEFVQNGVFMSVGDGDREFVGLHPHFMKPELFK